MKSHTITPVAIAHTSFDEKFGIPRQPGLVDIPAVIELLPPYNQPEAVEGLDQVSHLWLTFIFSSNLDDELRLKVRPPRLGGNRKVGVFATRSSFRPNALGQSLVKLERVEIREGAVLLHVSGVDLLNGTPVVDIKPYLPYADIIDHAVNHLAPAAPDLQALQVHWEEAALQHLQTLGHGRQVQQCITGLVALDPRPAYAEGQPAHEARVYGMAVFGMNVRWQVSGKMALILSVEPLNVDF